MIGAGDLAKSILTQVYGLFDWMLDDSGWALETHVCTYCKYSLDHNTVNLQITHEVIPEANFAAVTNHVVTRIIGLKELKSCNFFL